MRFAPFFFFFFFEFRPDSAISADTGRYGPSRPDLGRVGADFGHVGADFSRVGPIRESPCGTTRHGRAVCGVPPASPRPAASDAGALAWEPRPCIPDRHTHCLYHPSFVVGHYYFITQVTNSTHKKNFKHQLYLFQSKTILNLNHQLHTQKITWKELRSIHQIQVGT